MEFLRSFEAKLRSRIRLSFVARPRNSSHVLRLLTRALRLPIGDPDRHRLGLPRRWPRTRRAGRATARAPSTPNKSAWAVLGLFILSTPNRLQDPSYLYSKAMCADTGRMMIMCITEPYSNDTVIALMGLRRSSPGRSSSYADGRNSFKHRGSRPGNDECKNVCHARN
jgi:hypothetical protein